MEIEYVRTYPNISSREKKKPDDIYYKDIKL